jgi:phosphate transport system permease protein
MTRAMEEAVRTVPLQLKEISYAMGATRLETTIAVVLKQALPGMITAFVLAFGRGIGDAASILFTAGFTDFVPRSLTDSAAALPTMIFFLSTSPLAEVRARAYAAAFVLLILVLTVSVVSRLLSTRLSRYVVK